MDGINPTAATANAQPQLGQQYGFEAQNLLTQLQSKLPMGTTMLAQVLGNDKNGNLIVKVNGSDLLLSSPLALQKGAQVQMKLDVVGGHISAQILSIDGKLPVYRPQNSDGQYQSPKGNEQNSLPVRIITTLTEGGAKTLVAQGMAAQNATLAATHVDQVNLSSPQTTMMRAMVINPSPEIMQGIRATLALSVQSEEKLIKTLPSELKPGMEADIRITSAKQPQPAQPQTPAPANTQPENQKVDTSNTVLKGQEWMKQDVMENLQNPQPGLAQKLQPQINKPIYSQTGIYQANAYQEPDSLASTAKTQSQPQNLPADWMRNFAPTMKALPNGSLQINALVVDNSTEGELMVETKIGLIRIDGKTAGFQKGTELELEMLAFTKTDAPAKAKNELPTLSHEWPTLKNTLAENKTEAQKIAGSEHNFGGKLVNFLNAVRTGDAESWLGAEFLDQLDDMVRNTIVTKLNGDFANFRNLMAENPLNPWQTLLFPVFDGQELHQARLHVKKFKDDSAASADGYGTRFIVELDTSRYGEMQFDGLVRRQIPKKSFDLIIRTHTQLDAETKAEIVNIFNTTQEITGFKGGIEFASSPTFPVEPWKDIMNKKGPHDNLIS